MKLFFLVLTFAACFKIITSKGANRTIWLLYSLFFLSNDILIWGPFNAHFLFIASFILSLYFSKEFIPNYKFYPLRNISIIIFIIYLLIGLFDQRIPLISRISRPVTEFVTTYTAFFIGFCSIKSNNELHKVIQGFTKILIIVSIYGIITYILQNNPWYDLLTSTFNGEVGIWSGVQERGYRVCSFLSNPIVYSGVMGMYSLIILQMWHPKKKTIKYILISLLALSTLIANSRTGVFSTLLLYALFYFLKNRFSYKNLLIIFTVIILMTILYNISFIKPILDSSFDLFTTGGENIEGSNIDLKEQQWIVSLEYFNEAPFLGHGLAYFIEVIGNKNSYLNNPELAGMEGYQYKLLIEQGLLMIIAVLIFYVRLFIISWKNRNSNITSYLTIACIAAFIFFICSTGIYGSTFLYFGIYIGLLLRCTYDKKIFNSHSSLQRTKIHRQMSY